MGNINYNDKFDIGIVSPSYKIFSIADGYDKRFIAAMLKTHRALYNYMLVSEQGASVVRRNLNMEAFEQLVSKMPTIDKQREIGKRPYQKFFLVIGTALTTFVVCVLIGFLIHIFLN